MGKREAIIREVQEWPEDDLDTVLAILNSLKHEHNDARVSMLLAEACLAKEWLTPEEDAAWANL